MPIEIRELIIRSTVRNKQESGQKLSQEELARLKRTIIRDCMARIQEKLNDKMER